MSIDWIKEAEGIIDDITAWREYFHKNAELGNKEYKTAQKIEEILKSLNIKTFRILDTAVVGLLEVEGSKTCVAIRSDIDALPLKEETGLEFSSLNDGVMHACGHDLHIVGALAAAKLLSMHKEKLKNSVKFLFQPDEEGDGGALRMVNEGCLKNPEVSFVCGAHVVPSLPLGTIGIKSGAFYAASSPFTITFNGKSAHGAERHLGNDALAAAAYFTNEVLKLNSAESILTIGTFNAGTACNIVADKAKLSATVRTLSAKRREYVLNKIQELANKAEQKFGVTANLVFSQNAYIGITNSKSGFDKCKKVAKSIFKDTEKIIIEKATMKTEDFGFFTQNTDGCFYHIGTGGNNQLHSNNFTADTRTAVYIAAMHTGICFN